MLFAYKQVKKAVFGRDLQDLHRKRDIDRITGLTKGFPINYQVHPVILSKNSCFSPFLKIFLLCVLFGLCDRTKNAVSRRFFGNFLDVKRIGSYNM